MAHDKRPRTYQLASLFLAISGLAHVGGGMLNLFAERSFFMVAIGVIYLVAAMLLQAGRRWLAYFIFPPVTFGAVIAYMFYDGVLDAADITCLVIIAANLLCALVLFYALWRAKLRNA